MCEQVLLISLLLFLILAKKFPIIWSKFEFRVYLQLYKLVFEKKYNSSTLSTETTVQTLVNYTTRIQSLLTDYNKTKKKNTFKYTYSSLKSFNKEFKKSIIKSYPIKKKINRDQLGPIKSIKALTEYIL